MKNTVMVVPAVIVRDSEGRAFDIRISGEQLTPHVEESMWRLADYVAAREEQNGEALQHEIDIAEETRVNRMLRRSRRCSNKAPREMTEKQIAAAQRDCGAYLRKFIDEPRKRRSTVTLSRAERSLAARRRPIAYGARALRSAQKETFAYLRTIAD
ncbi:MAG TPA: hypothetical protein V6C81_13405 [Planktothrix sp.]|jgi:hypothetical protein